jgi:hypothetical protein
MKNSDFTATRNFACPLSRIAHLRHEGIAAAAENLAQEPRRAFSPASSGVAPLQNEIDKNRALSRSGVFIRIGRKATLSVRSANYRERLYSECVWD